MEEELKVRIFVTKGSLVLHEQHGTIDGGRHEFRLCQPLHNRGRAFHGFSVEFWTDEPNHLTLIGDDGNRKIEIPIP